MPRDANGNWVDTLTCRVDGKNSLLFTPEVVEGGQCMPWWSGFMYEASSWEYSLCIPHDVYGLIEKSGGTEAFKTRLDTFFKNAYYNVGNEPSFLSPTLYHWIGQPEQSSKTIHQIISNYFNILLVY